MQAVTIRPIKRTDLAEIERFLKGLSEFREEEIACALELVTASLKNGKSDEDYSVICAELNGSGVVGFICYGKTPLTKAAYDLYWIVTDPKHRRSGIGKSLLHNLEATLREKGVNILLAETSSLPTYSKACSFYEREGFRKESLIKDFYAPGDDKITYCKRY